MSHLPSHLFEEIYFNKTVVPRVPYCIGVWGCCSVAMITEIGNLHVKARRIAHKISKNCLEHEVLDLFKWQDLGYLYKRRLAIEFFKGKQDLNSWLLPFDPLIESKRKGPLLEINRIKTDLGRNSFYFRAPILCSSLDSSSRLLDKLENFKTKLKCKKTLLRKVTFFPGTITNLNKDVDYLINYYL